MLTLAYKEWKENPQAKQQRLSAREFSLSATYEMMESTNFDVKAGNGLSGAIATHTLAMWNFGQNYCNCTAKGGGTKNVRRERKKKQRGIIVSVAFFNVHAEYWFTDKRWPKARTDIFACIFMIFDRPYREKKEVVSCELWYAKDCDVTGRILISGNTWVFRCFRQLYNIWATEAHAFYKTWVQVVSCT